MSTPTPKVTPRRDPKDRTRSRSAAGRRSAPARPVTHSDPPDWTEQWKLQVEAEARRLLKKSLRGVGREK